MATNPANAWRLQEPFPPREPKPYLDPPQPEHVHVKTKAPKATA